MDGEILDGIQNWLIINSPTIGFTLLYMAAIYCAYRLLSLWISWAQKRSHIDRHVENVLRLFLRVVALLVALSALFRLYELPATLFLGSSALVGAMLGFGSSQTINNIAAGFYVIFAKPFRVADYVKIGDVEGQVDEITINYTKLYTPTFNLMEIPNVQVLNSRILNCTHEGFIKNTFLFTTPHSVPLRNDEILGKCIEPAIREVMEKYPEVMTRKPEAYFDTSTHFGRSYKIRLFIPKGMAKTMYVIQSELSNRIMDLWDRERTAKA
ncbi:mechanosensitive ion channel [Candidatus Bathyarchaeota archaeon]|nr:mechanosensitive ion channel [Candidatus Bathyarchaeota archaeon]